MKSRILLTAPLLLASLAAVAQTTPLPATVEKAFALKRVPKVGDLLQYTLLIKTKLNGVDAVVNSKIKTKIVKIAEDGAYTDESEETDTIVKVADQEIPIPSEGPHGQATDAKGYVTEISGKSADGSDYRTTNAMLLIYPKKDVKVGDTWDADFPANSKLGTFAAKANYTFAAIEKVGKEDCARINWKYAESTPTTPISVEGQMWIRLRDGAMVKLRAAVKNAPLDPNSPPADMTVEIDSA